MAKMNWDRVRRENNIRRSARRYCINKEKELLLKETERWEKENLEYEKYGIRRG